MKLQFSLEYRTQWGQSVAVELTLYRHQGIRVNSRISLDTSDGLQWSGDVQVIERDVASFEYRYVIVENDQIVRREWNAVPRRFPADSTRTFIFPDYWRDIPQLNHLYSSAYIHAVSHFEAKDPNFVYYEQTLVFRVQAPQLHEGQALALLGSQPPLGAWDPLRALRMERAGINEWVVSLSAAYLYLPFEYKYVIVDEETGNLIQWEEGDNRLSPSGSIPQNHVVVIYDEIIHVADEHWKAAGIVIPLFSLRSAMSQGIGDFGDLKRMVDWADQAGMTVIQLLPINDTTQTHTWTDSYPYNCISIYALHPMYIDLQQLPPVNDAAFMLEYEKKRRELNALKQVDYEQVNILKQDYLQRLFKQEGQRVLKSAEYEEFYQKNQEWLVPYTAFCMLRDKYGTSDFHRWPHFKTYKAEDIYALVEKKAKGTSFYAFQQYILDKQLSETTVYARSRGVVLKGDVPIGISRHSVEAWKEPFYFHMNGQAGAPPDDFSVNGQNWGFPTYDWDCMAQDGYRWWIRRFRKMAEYFDAFRIDHVLGFFRIWEIPLHSVHGLLGQFSPALPMSADEIEGFGLHFQKELFTQPYITDQVLTSIFGGMADHVRTAYLTKIDDTRYAMRPEYATQRQVEAVFQGMSDDSSIALRDGLYSLISDVLFVPDIHNPELYHPRISATEDYIFRNLSWHDQEAFRCLYEHYFYHRHNDFWYDQAMKKLPSLVESTQMLACGEDLGMVPACVGPAMERLRMLSLEIQAMPKTPGLLFGHLGDNPYRSVSTIFTHDMATLRAWWEEDYDRTQRYYNEILHHDGSTPRVMPGWLAEEVISRHLYCPSMLCLFSFQDWISMDEKLRYPYPDDERINIPSIPRHQWRYRMHLTIEDLMQAIDFNTHVRLLIQRGGRLN